MDLCPRLAARSHRQRLHALRLLADQGRASCVGRRGHPEVNGWRQGSLARPCAELEGAAQARHDLPPRVHQRQHQHQKQGRPQRPGIAARQVGTRRAQPQPIQAVDQPLAMQRPKVPGRRILEVAGQAVVERTQWLVRDAAVLFQPRQCRSPGREGNSRSRAPQGIANMAPVNAASSATCSGNGTTNQRPNKDRTTNAPSTASAGHKAGQNRSTVTTSRASHP